jgi:hypothetical protein
MKTHIQRTYMVVFTLFAFLFSTCKKTSSDNRFDGSIQIKLSTEGSAYVQLSLGVVFHFYKLYKKIKGELLAIGLIRNKWLLQTKI